MKTRRRVFVDKRAVMDPFPEVEERGLEERTP